MGGLDRISRVSVIGIESGWLQVQDHLQYSWGNLHPAALLGHVARLCVNPKPMNLQARTFARAWALRALNPNPEGWRHLQPFWEDYGDLVSKVMREMTGVRIRGAR